MNLGENPTLKQVVQSDNQIKEWLVAYVGEKTSPENGEVTVEMIIDIIANEFPEFLLAIAEENWIRGYHQALTDVDEGEKAYQEQLRKHNESETDTNY